MVVHPSSTITIHRPSSSSGVDSDESDVSTLSGSEGTAERRRGSQRAGSGSHRRRCRSSPRLSSVVKTIDRTETMDQPSLVTPKPKYIDGFPSERGVLHRRRSRSSEYMHRSQRDNHHTPRYSKRVSSIEQSDTAIDRTESITTKTSEKQSLFTPKQSTRLKYLDHRDTTSNRRLRSTRLASILSSGKKKTISGTNAMMTPSTEEPSFVPTKPIRSKYISQSPRDSFRRRSRSSPRLSSVVKPIGGIEMPIEVSDSMSTNTEQLPIVTPRPIRPTYIHRSFWRVPASTPDFHPSPATANTRSTASSSILNSPFYTNSSEIDDIRVKILGLRAQRSPSRSPQRSLRVHRSLSRSSSRERVRSARSPPRERSFSHSHRKSPKEVPNARKSPVKRVDDLYLSMVEEFNKNDSSKGNDGEEKCSPIDNSGTSRNLVALEPPTLKRVLCDNEASASANASWSSIISDEQDDLSSKESAFRRVGRQERRPSIKTASTIQGSESSFSPYSMTRQQPKIRAEQEEAITTNSGDGSAKSTGDAVTTITTPTSTHKSVSTSKSKSQGQNDAVVAQINIDMTARSSKNNPEVYDIFSEIERDLLKNGLNVKINVINNGQSKKSALETVQANFRKASGSNERTPPRGKEGKVTSSSALKKKHRRGLVKHNSLSSVDYAGLLSPAIDDASSKQISDDEWTLGSRQFKRNWMSRRKASNKGSTNPNVLSDNTPVLLSKIRFSTKKVLRRSTEDQDHLLNKQNTSSESDWQDLFL